MGDFLTRLAEQALDVTPVVQPMLAPVFAPDPTSHSTGLGWDGETPASSGDLDRPRVPSAQETPPVWDLPTRQPEDTALAQQEDRSGLGPTTPGHPQETPDTWSGLHHPAEADSAERGVRSAREDQGNSPLATTGRQLTPERPEPLHPAESGPTRHGEGVSTLHRASSEGLPSGSSPAEDVSERA